MADYYEMTICGLKRRLVKCPLNDKIDIAAFIMLGDVELTVAAASALLGKSPEFDVLLTAEAKGIPLAYEMARQSGKPYLVGRKSRKLYMNEPLSVNVKSITTDRVQTIFMDKDETQLLQGRRVLVVDDVISTGESLKALEALVHLAGGEIVGESAVLAEGDAIDRKDIVYLEPLPLFFK